MHRGSSIAPQILSKLEFTVQVSAILHTYSLVQVLHTLKEVPSLDLPKCRCAALRLCMPTVQTIAATAPLNVTLQNHTGVASLYRVKCNPHMPTAYIIQGSARRSRPPCGASAAVAAEPQRSHKTTNLCPLHNLQMKAVPKLYCRSAHTVWQNICSLTHIPRTTRSVGELWDTTESSWQQPLNSNPLE